MYLFLAWDSPEKAVIKFCSVLLPFKFISRRSFYKIDNNKIIVIYDDISLEIGKLRIREKGSAGGHNGIKSIIANMGTDVFPRIKIGVGQPKGDLVSHVLGRFNKDEEEDLKEVIEASNKATEIIIQYGAKQAMNELNGFKLSKNE